MKKFLFASALLVASVSAVAAPNFDIQTNDDVSPQPNQVIWYSNEYAVGGVTDNHCGPIDGGSRYECSGALKSTNKQKSATVQVELRSTKTGDQCTVAFSTVPGTNQVIYDKAESSCIGLGNWQQGKIAGPVPASAVVYQNH